jgi:hypothetical protein
MSTASWTDEFETSGRVVFPQRRNRLLIRLAVGVLLFGNSLWTIVTHIRDNDMGGAMGVLRLTAFAAFVYLVAVTAWQLITRRPAVTIDRAGITFGKKLGKLPWDQIAGINDPSGIRGFRSIQVQPVDRWRASSLGISQDNVLELTELTHWLRTLHEQQRAD